MWSARKAVLLHLVWSARKAYQIQEFPEGPIAHLRLTLRQLRFLTNVNINKPLKKICPTGPTVGANGPTSPTVGPIGAGLGDEQTDRHT